jgi:hypothetical protein
MFILHIALAICFSIDPFAVAWGVNFILLPSISATQLYRSRHSQRINILDNDFTISTFHGLRRMHGFNELWRKGISLHCIYRPYCPGHKLQKLILGIISWDYTRASWRFGKVGRLNFCIELCPYYDRHL